MATVEHTQITETDLQNAVADKAKKLGVKRYFTIPGREPFDEIEWEVRDAFIPGKEKAAFDQKSVEFPKFWSQTATNIVAQKYFRGKLGTPDREARLKPMIGRLADTLGADASAGTVKSGGKTRRAAKMVILDVDHPDIEHFIWCKATEEQKARVLEAAGYDMALDSEHWASSQYQNANNSVRVTDAFMEAAEAGAEWNLTARTDGTVVDTVDARTLLRQIAEAAWKCADPGVQYD